MNFKLYLKDEYWPFFSKELRKVSKENIDPNNLKAQLEDKINFISEQKSQIRYFDEELTDNLITQAMMLLEGLDRKGLTEDERLEIMATISYFVNGEDAIDDNEFYDGYKDDYEIMKALIRYYDLPGPLSD